MRQLAGNTEAAVIRISETWLDDNISDNELKITGYALERKDRNRHGGGVCLYIKDNLSYNRRDDLSDKTLEILFVEICLPKTKPFIIGSSSFARPNTPVYIESFIFS